MLLLRSCLRTPLLVAVVWCVCSARAAVTPMTIVTAKGSVWWTGKAAGLGGFSLVATLPTTLTNLQQIAVAQPGFLSRAGWPGLNLWDEWVTKDTATTRNYSYRGQMNGKNFGYTVSLVLNKGVLTIKAGGAMRGYVNGMFDLANTTTSGIASFTYAVDLKDHGGMTVVDGSATIQMDYENKADKKSATTMHKD